jgi:hypothetical protein
VAIPSISNLKNGGKIGNQEMESEIVVPTVA